MGPLAMALKAPQAELRLQVGPKPMAEPQRVLALDGSAQSSPHSPEASPKACSRAAPLAPQAEPAGPRGPLAWVPKSGTAARWLVFAALAAGHGEQGRIAVRPQALPALGP